MRAIFEAGIGEDRAVILDSDRLVEAHIERPGIRVGDIWDARLIALDAGRGRVTLGDEEAVLDAVPRAASEGGLLRVEVKREPISPGRATGKPPQVRATGATPGRAPGLVAPGPKLRDRLIARGLALTDAAAHGPDLLEQVGWSETIEDAHLLRPIMFEGGELVLDQTEAMLVIDVDGSLPPAPLALAAADVAARAIQRFGVGGPTVIDFPTVADREIRKRIGEIVDGVLSPPFERTAVNGFGLMQIVRPRERLSLIEHVGSDNLATDAHRLLRIAERAQGPGEAVISASAGVIGYLEHRPALLAELERRTGRRAVLRVDPSQTMSGGHVHVQA